MLLALIVIPIILLSFTIHEYAHAWMANRLGDPTAKLEGRLSFNPANHWDPIGTSLLVGLLILQSLGMNVFAFGWGKPVPIDPRHFKNFKVDSFKTALAGPLSNLLIAVILAIILKIIPSTDISGFILLSTISINVFLAIFNLIPLPPLDGSRILQLILPDEIYGRFESLSSVYMMAIIFLIFLFPGIISSIVQSIINILV